VSRFVVDASVALAWCFPDEDAPVAHTVATMLRHGDTALVTTFWPHEVVNALLVGEKRRRISASLAATFLSELSALPIVIVPCSTVEVFSRIQLLAREYGLTPYDAAYLDLAKVNGLPLATLDDDLIRASGKAGVALL